MKNEILIELIKNQKKDIPIDRKLTYHDLNKISKYLNSSIFNDECSLWTGFFTTIKTDKNTYINFYFNGKKYALHRLLYINYIGDLDNSEYIKFKCPNKGKCCNINHFYKLSQNELPSLEPKLSPIIDGLPDKNNIVNFNL